MADSLLTRSTRVSPFYRAWVNMKTRCNNQNSPDYIRYGGRGIKHCDKWKTFDGFIEDMYQGYKTGLTLDRIDNNKGYSKANCRWVDRKIQAQNTRNVEKAKKLSFNGKTMTIRGWARETGIKRRTLSQRVFGMKWSTEKALTKGVIYG